MPFNQSVYTYKPLTTDNWDDLVQLFGSHGAYGGCWCTFFRQTRKEYSVNSGEKNKTFLHSLVNAGQPIGLIAYSASRPVGWCAISPRENYSSLERSRVYKRVDDQPVWSLTCFYTARDYRRKGVSLYLIKAAIAYVGDHGGNIVEAYPEVTNGESIPAGDAYTGILDVFKKLGFQEVTGEKISRPVVRYYIA